MGDVPAIPAAGSGLRPSLTRASCVMPALSRPDIPSPRHELQQALTAW
jgi:hypothetical protein